MKTVLIYALTIFFSLLVIHPSDLERIRRGGERDSTRGVVPSTKRPILQSESIGRWSANDSILGEYQNEWLGFSIAAIGDINGDRYGDVAIGIPNWNQFGSNEGAVLVVLGLAGGLDYSSKRILPSGSPGALLGRTISPAGDLNLDGYRDFIAGAPLYQSSGAAVIYWGSPYWSIPTFQPDTSMIVGNQVGAKFGCSVAGGGDLNRDGIDDILIGAALFDADSANQGAVFRFLTGACLTPSKPCDPEIDEDSLDPDSRPCYFDYCYELDTILISANVSYFGYHVQFVDDIDGDGYSDFFASAQDPSGLHAGGISFQFLGDSVTLLDLGSFVSYYDGLAWDGGGISKVEGAGDINGDGKADVVSGLYDSLRHAQVFYGTSAGLDTVNIDTVHRMGKEKCRGHFENEPFQCESALDPDWSVSGNFDLNGNGFADVIVGRIGNWDSIKESIPLLFYGGGSLGLDSMPVDTIWAPSDALIKNDEARIVPAGDINGDGLPDLLVGDPLSSYGGIEERGAVQVIYGKADGIVPSRGVTIGVGSQAGNQFGFTSKVVGDVNGDGYHELLVGAPGYGGGNGLVLLYPGSATGVELQSPIQISCNQAGIGFGERGVAAGDLNGDGKMDFVFYSRLFVTSPQDTGAIFIFYGDSNLAQIGNSPQIIGTEGGVGAEEVAIFGVGDANRDGYMELVVGEPGMSRLKVYYGSEFGIDSLNFETIQGVMGSAFGEKGAAAGDVNGDGNADLVGAWKDSALGEWVATTFLGSPCGFSSEAMPAFLRGGIPTSANLNIVGGGDINGDGLSDLLVGVATGSLGLPNEGVVYVFQSHPGGIDSIPELILHGGLPHANFGAAMASAGDVNNDGYEDVLIGASGWNGGEGGVAVFLGSRDGIDTTSVVILQDSTGNVGFGSSISAGDLGGDGFTDVIVGTPSYSIGAPNRGAVYIYRGNGGQCRKVLVTQRQPFGTHDLLGPGGATDSSGHVLLQMVGASFWGRQKTQLLVEIARSGQPFSKGSNGKVSNSVNYSWKGPFTDVMSNDSFPEVLEAHLTGLEDSIKYNWRARLSYTTTNSNGMLYGQWFYPSCELPEIPIGGFQTGRRPFRDIDIEGNLVQIQNGDASPDSLDWTKFGCAVQCRDSTTRTFVIHNYGVASLSITSVSMAAGSQSAFACISPLPGAIPPQDSVAILIRFAPQEDTILTDTLLIQSNDCADGVYRFLLQGCGLKDTVPPTVSCPNDTVLCEPVFAWPAIVPEDLCGIDTLILSDSSGTSFGEGTTRVVATATDVNGNSDSCTFRVTVLPIPDPGLHPSPVAYACFGDSIPIACTEGFLQYNWSTGDHSETSGIMAIEPDTVTVTVVDSFGCIGAAQTIVAIRPLPVAKLGLDDGAIHTTVEYASYEWYSTNPSQGQLWNGPELRVLLPGNYYAVVEDVHGCEDISDTLEYQPECPNGITTCVVEFPNPAVGIVNIVPLSPIDYPLSLKIFDQLGRLVWSRSYLELPEPKKLDLTQLSAGEYRVVIEVDAPGGKVTSWLRLVLLQ